MRLDDGTRAAVMVLDVSSSGAILSGLGHRATGTGGRLVIAGHATELPFTVVHCDGQRNGVQFVLNDAAQAAWESRMMQNLPRQAA